MIFWIGWQQPKNQLQLIINGTSKKAENQEFRTLITETIIYATTTTVDDHRNQNKNIHYPCMYYCYY